MNRAAKVGGVVMALSTVAGGMAAAIPERMQLTSQMKSKDWSKSSLVPIQLTVGVQELDAKPANEIIHEHTGKYGSIAFVVRRPG